MWILPCLQRARLAGPPSVNGEVGMHYSEKLDTTVCGEATIDRDDYPRDKLCCRAHQPE